MPCRNVCFYLCLFWQKNKKLTRNHLTKHHWAFCINLNFICIWGYIEQSFWWVFIILMIKTWPPWSIMYKHVWRSSCYCTLDLFWWIQWILLPSSPSYLSVTTGGRLHRNSLYVFAKTTTFQKTMEFSQILSFFCFLEIFFRFIPYCLRKS